MTLLSAVIVVGAAIADSLIDHVRGANDLVTIAEIALRAEAVTAIATSHRVLPCKIISIQQKNQSD